MTRLWIVPAALLCLLLADYFVTPVISAPAPPMRRPKVEIVFVVDTTGSMSLIEPMKQKIYGLCNLILSARPTPELRVGLVAFKDRDSPGNKEEYVIKPFDLRDNLDEVFAEFKTYSATGGGDTPEAVNEALDHALTKLSWTKDRRTVRMMFLIGDAAPHMDYMDDVKYQVTCKRAADLGIPIHAIQSGSDKECDEHFAAIARLSGGVHLKVDSSGGFKNWSTDYDVKMRELSQQLFRSAMPFGTGASRDQATKRMQQLVGLTGEAQLDRAALLSRTRRLGDNDLLDAVMMGRVRLAEMKAEDLPEALRSLPENQRAAQLEKWIDQRQKLIEAIGELDRKRVASLLKRIEENPNGMDAQIFLTFRKRAVPLLKYSNE